MDKDMMKKNSNQHDTSEVGICRCSVVTQCKKGYNEIRKVPKMVPELRELTYEDRLKEMGLQILQDRIERGDLKTLYKIRISKWN